MNMRRTNTRWLAGTLALLCLFLVGAGQVKAQEGTLTWAYMYQAKPGEGSELVELIKRHFGDVIEEQIAAGTVMGWGIGEVVNYQGGYTHMEWLHFPNWEALSRAEEGFSAAWEKKSQADKNAIRRGFEDVLQQRVHQRVASAVVRKLADRGDPPRYVVTGEWSARPGKAAAGTRLYNEAAVPVYEKLFTEDAIGGYGMVVPAMHDGDWTHWTWFVVHDLGEVGSVLDALAAISGDDLEKRLAEVFDRATHRDTIYRIVHLDGLADE